MGLNILILWPGRCEPLNEQLVCAGPRPEWISAVSKQI